MSRLREYREIQFHQACAIARVVLLRDPSVTNFDWSEEVKRTCVKQGYRPPEGDMLLRSMHAVERALAAEGRPRPGPAPAYVPVPPAATHERPLSRDEARRALAQLGAIVKSIPPAPRFTRRQADGLRVIKTVYAPAAIESILRCEEYERIAAEAEKAS